MRPQIKARDTVHLRTDGEIGERNMYIYTEGLLGRKLLVQSVDGRKFLAKTNGSGFCSEFDCIDYEICISSQSLAPEGTAEWAWHMMLLGHRVSQKASCAEYYAIYNGECYPYYDCNGTINRFGNKLEFCKPLPYRYSTGWQIYKPEPKTGTPEWAWGKTAEKHKVFRKDNGTVYQMNVCGYVIANNGEFSYNYEQFLMIEHKNDWQIYEPELKLEENKMTNTFNKGDKVRLIDNEINRAEHILAISQTFVVYDLHKSLVGVKTINDDENIELDLALHYSRFELISNPKFEVGQFVKCRFTEACTYCITSPKNKNSEHEITNISNGVKSKYYSWHLTPILAKDVVLDFGNGVVGWIKPNGKRNIDVLSKGNCWLACIRVSILTEPMKSIVETVLARQEIEEQAK